MLTGVSVVPAATFEFLRYTVRTSMIPGRIGYELAVVAVFAVLTIFLFPAMQGPYSVVHGPASALLAARSASRLLSTMARGALSFLRNRRVSPLVVLSQMSSSKLEFQPLRLPDFSPILRC